MVNKRSVLNLSLFVIGVGLTVYILQHLDSVAEFMFDMEVKLLMPFADNSRAIALSIVNVECNRTDTICMINAINEWVYRNVPYNITKLHSKLMDFNDILKEGGVCHHKTLVAMILLKRLGINNCKIQTEVVINDGVNVGHEWFECKINATHKLSCDPTNKPKCEVLFER